MAANESITKTCSKCCGTKPITEFYKDASKCDGFTSSCKACHKLRLLVLSDAQRENAKEYAKAYNAKYRAANREELKEKKAAYRKANLDKIKARDAAYYTANREAIKSNVAAYRADNPDKRIEWCAANLDAFRSYNHNRRARIRASVGKLSPDITERLLTLQRGKCACCGKPLGDDYHLDHIMPLALGGTNTDNNMQLLRSTCNQQKHAKHPVDFMRQRGFLI